MNLFDEYRRFAEKGEHFVCLSALNLCLVAHEHRRSLKVLGLQHLFNASDHGPFVHVPLWVVEGICAAESRMIEGDASTLNEAFNLPRMTPKRMSRELVKATTRVRVYVLVERGTPVTKALEQVADEMALGRDTLYKWHYGSKDRPGL